MSLYLSNGFLGGGINFKKIKKIFNSLPKQHYAPKKSTKDNSG